MKLLFLLIGMVMVLEGMPYVAAPEKMKCWLAKLAELEPSALRAFGLVSMLGGLLLCYLVQKTAFFS